MSTSEIAVHDLELVFALAGPAGADLQQISRCLADALRKAEYQLVEEISVSQQIQAIASRRKLTTKDGSVIELLSSPEDKRIESYIEAGNAIRRLAADDAALASAAIADISRRRTVAGGKPSRRAYIIRSLKRPEEAHLLRRVYGTGFFLIGVNIAAPDRVAALAERIAKSHGETTASPKYAERKLAAGELSKRDEDEALEEHGQRVRDVFQLCDLFINPAGTEKSFDEIFRLVRLILGDLSETPRRDEQFMFHAFAASLSSGALGRQVGAALVALTGEMLGVGWNDVPRGGGGLYRADDHYDRRDIKAARDAVNVNADEMLQEILDAARDAGWLPDGKEVQIAQAREVFRKSRVMSLLEFGRTTHAEMEAVLAAARSGVPVRNATLYTTTYPCHECARLIVTAGIERVVYIEPYPKSKALQLHADAIEIPGGETIHCGKPGCQERHAVRFEPFVGIGPHRYADLFSMAASSGIVRDRKDKATGERIEWDPKRSLPKVEMLPMSYLEQEDRALAQFRKLVGENDSGG